MNLRSCSAVLVVSLTILWNVISASSADDIQSVIKENRLLKSELNLAAGTKVYFLFNLGREKVYIKIRGTVLRELSVMRSAAWNWDEDAVTLTLTEKSALFKPKRGEIKPQGNDDSNADTFDIDALELEDMPSRFKLVFDNGAVIKIRPASDGLLSSVGERMDMLLWYLSRPSVTFFNYLRGKSAPSFYVTLSREDAQSLYWAFPEGTGCVISSF